MLAALCILMVRGAEFQVDGIWYATSDDNGGCEVTYKPAGVYTGNVVIPSSVTFSGKDYKVSGISAYAFAGSSDLTSVSIPASIETIGRNAFQSCRSLSSLSLPSAVWELKEETFYECVNLVSLSAPNVERIGEYAFANCHSLTDLKLSQNVAFVDDGGFRECKSLTSFIFGKNAELGEGVFSGCTSLSKVYFPSSLSEIPPYTFSECSHLTAVHGTGGVKKIGEFAFYSCGSLKTFEFNSETEAIGRNAFALCSQLNIHLITGSGLSIGDYAFTGCGAIKKLELEGTVEIGIEAFANAALLTSISFDPSMKYIRERAFRNCNIISYVGCMAEIPPFMANNSFEDAIYKTATLHVPFSMSLLYKQTPPWSYFVSVTESTDTGVDTVSDIDTGFETYVEGSTLTIEGPEGEAAVFSHTGLNVFRGRKDAGKIEINLPERGVYIVKVNGNTKKIITK